MWILDTDPLWVKCGKQIREWQLGCCVGISRDNQILYIQSGPAYEFTSYIVELSCPLQSFPLWWRLVLLQFPLTILVTQVTSGGEVLRVVCGQRWILAENQPPLFGVEYSCFRFLFSSDSPSFVATDCATLGAHMRSPMARLAHSSGGYYPGDERNV